jgi:Archaea-specific editing domain of threonyl-tRNA synthetase
MKLLMIYSDLFGYKTSVKTLESVGEYTENREITDVLVGFIQVEKKDEDELSKVETKLIKNLKWAAKKNSSKKILLHSFAHLSSSKADENTTKMLFDNAEKRLITAGYETSQTPFGYFLDLDMKAPGKSLARIFKEF